MNVDPGSVKNVVSGAMTMMYLLAGLFFLRFWSRTKDGLFIYFAIAFWILAAQRFGLGITSEGLEYDVWFYLARLIAFVLILAGIWQKNLPKRNR